MIILTLRCISQKTDAREMYNKPINKIPANKNNNKKQIFQSRPQDALVGSTKPEEATEKLRQLIAEMEWWVGGLLLICGDEDGDIDGVEDAEGFADADDYDDDSCEDLEQQQ